MATDSMLWHGTFTEDFVDEFAELSGDWNPIHVDALRARRLLFGARVVHGMAGVLRMLDAFLASGGAVPGSIRVTFRAPLLLDRPAAVELRVPGADGAAAGAAAIDGREPIRLVLRCGDEEAITAVLGGRGEPVDVAPRERVPLRTNPQARFFDDAGPRSGAVSVDTDTARLRAIFPAAWRELGPGRVTALAALSRLVGMILPGEDSLFVAASLEFVGAGHSLEPMLAWEVTRARAAVAPVEVAVAGAGISGSVSAVYRPKPVEQPSMAMLRALVRPGEFRGEHALVIGGSRGLGEVMAKLVAAGGGAVTLTYARGRQDAERVQAEIAPFARWSEVMQADVDDLTSLMTSIPAPTQVSYMATPTITAAGDAADHARLADLYVDRFAAMVAQVVQAGWRPVSIFYPSTVFIDAPPAGMEPYARAKRAGELVCRELSAEHPELSIVVRRLPRMATDQTNALIRQPCADAVPILLEVVRALARPRGGEPR